MTTRRWLLAGFALGLLMGLLLTIEVYALECQAVTATWYGRPYNHRQTACGETFHADKYTVACNWLPCGTIVKLTYGNQVVYARVTDRYDQSDPLNQGWRVDVSEGIAEVMGWRSLGRVVLELEIIK